MDQLSEARQGVSKMESSAMDLFYEENPSAEAWFLQSMDVIGFYMRKSFGLDVGEKPSALPRKIQGMPGVFY